jgi:hypothetical protein
MTGEDIREVDLTRQEVSNMIGDLKSKGDHTLPAGKKYTDKHGDETDFICTKEALKKTANKLWDKETRPFTVGAVVENKKKLTRQEEHKLGLANKSSGIWALDLIKKAEAAGEEAMRALIDSKKVKPMVVQQHENMLDDNSPVKESWVVQGGPCGFASIRVKCTNGPSRKFINELKKAGLAGGQNSHKEWSKSDYYGGFMKSFTLIGGQSLAYKEAYAYAYAGVLNEADINTWVWTRMD